MSMTTALAGGRIADRFTDPGMSGPAAVTCGSCVGRIRPCLHHKTRRPRTCSHIIEHGCAGARPDRDDPACPAFVFGTDNRGDAFRHQHLLPIRRQPFPRPQDAKDARGWRRISPRRQKADLGTVAPGCIAGDDLGNDIGIGGRPAHWPWQTTQPIDQSLKPAFRHCSRKITTRQLHPAVPRW
nr:hypothetical protein [uncultured Tistrella sp.]